MLKKVKFENGVREVQISNSSGFNYLNLTSATISKVKYGEEVPTVEMIILNDRKIFTLCSNLIPVTNKLYCFYLL